MEADEGPKPPGDAERDEAAPEPEDVEPTEDIEPGSEIEPAEESPLPGSALRERARTADQEPRLIRAARVARRILPGDAQLGDDPLSTAGDLPSQKLAKTVSEASQERPSIMREVGLGALQVWQALSEAQGRGRGDVEVAILFTDLVDFSQWALSAGDEAALAFLRRVGKAGETAIDDHGGHVVKRLGDGLMAVFDDANDAVTAAMEARIAVGEVEADGYRPKLRAGVHVGRPRRVGGDYLGVDVNVAARVASASKSDLVISGQTRDRLQPGAFRLKRRRWFRAKGTPKDLEVYTVVA